VRYLQVFEKIQAAERHWLDVVDVDVARLNVPAAQPAGVAIAGDDSSAQLERKRGTFAWFFVGVAEVIQPALSAVRVGLDVISAH